MHLPQTKSVTSLQQKVQRMRYGHFAINEANFGIEKLIEKVELPIMEALRIVKPNQVYKAQILFYQDKKEKVKRQPIQIFL